MRRRHRKSCATAIGRYQGEVARIQSNCRRACATPRHSLCALCCETYLRGERRGSGGAGRVRHEDGEEREGGQERDGKGVPDVDVSGEITLVRGGSMRRGDGGATLSSGGPRTPGFAGEYVEHQDRHSVQEAPVTLRSLHLVVHAMLCWHTWRGCFRLRACKADQVVLLQSSWIAVALHALAGKLLAFECLAGECIKGARACGCACVMCVSSLLKHHSLLTHHDAAAAPAAHPTQDCASAVVWLAYGCASAAGSSLLSLESSSSCGEEPTRCLAQAGAHDIARPRFVRTHRALARGGASAL